MHAYLNFSWLNYSFEINLSCTENKDKQLKRLNQMESERRQKKECKLPEKRAIKRKRIFSPDNHQLKALNFKLQNGRLFIYMIIDFFAMNE